MTDVYMYPIIHQQCLEQTITDCKVAIIKFSALVDGCCATGRLVQKSIGACVRPSHGDNSVFAVEHAPGD